jgi:ribosomal protein S18 acetylase RimI-like enzyme
MEVSLIKNEVKEPKELKNDANLKEDIDESKFSNQFPSFSNLQSFNEFVVPDNSILKDPCRDIMQIPETLVTQCKISLIFSSNITYKNFQIMRNQFLLIFKVAYPEDFFKKIYDKKYFTIFGMDKSSKELICFAVIDIKLEEKNADILALGVVKEYQNKKIGSCLLKKVLEELTCMGINNSNLMVQQTNQNAIKLYKKFGFRIEKNFDDYYNFKSERENQAFKMNKTLISKKFWIFGLFKKFTEIVSLKKNTNISKKS